MEIHHLTDVHRQIVFLNRGEIKMPFPLPPYINLTPMTFKKANQFKRYDDFVRSAVELLRRIEYGDGGRRIRFLCKFYASLVQVFFYEAVHVYSNDQKKAVDQIYGMMEFDEIKRARIENNWNFNVFSVIDMFFVKLAKNFPRGRFIVNVIEFVKKYSDRTDGTSLFLHVRDEFEPNIGRFLPDYQGSFVVNPYITFQWFGLSSGQAALLNLYSRFFALADKQMFGDGKLKQNLIILIDEGEVYFHPMWQKKFLNLLLSFLPKVYRKDEGAGRNIQLILTSNSPFIASDLPNSNVIFLAADEEGTNAVVQDLEQKKQTFAANIHTLFTDSFFMDEGLIGEFAKSRVNQLINFLLHSDPFNIQENGAILDTMIGLIGEPVVRNKIAQIRQSRLAEIPVHEHKTIDEQIEELEEKLLTLRKRKEQLQDDSDPYQK